MTFDEAPNAGVVTALRACGPAAAQHRSAGGRFGYGADAGRDDSLGGPWELASMSSPSGFKLNMDCA
jgi:hypothetical protein